MRTGIANLPLHRGHCPPWLFAHMTRLAAAIAEAIVLHYGPAELLRRLSDPVWFQSFGCVLGFDWHSSGVTTVVCGALKEGLAPRSAELGVFVCGGKGGRSRQTPTEIAQATERHGLPVDPDRLTLASRLAAKVDNAAVLDGYQLYHHTFVFTRDGRWAVIQQGMNEGRRYARRYHWLGEGLASFVEEPHSGVCGDRRAPTVNLVARESAACREALVELVQRPEATLRDYRRLLDLDGPRLRVLTMGAEHAIPRAEHLERVLLRAAQRAPADFAGLLATEGLGPKAVRALALVAEVIHGVPPSRRDPVRYTFAHGGKDGHPYPVDRRLYRHTLEILEDAIRKARTGDRERDQALRRLAGLLGDA